MWINILLISFVVGINARDIPESRHPIILGKQKLIFRIQRCPKVFFHSPQLWKINFAIRHINIQYNFFLIFLSGLIPTKLTKVLFLQLLEHLTLFKYPLSKPNPVGGYITPASNLNTF